MALDQGTSSSRAVIFDRRGDVLALIQAPLVQHYPRPGWVEHDPEEIWESQLHCARAALHQSGLKPQEIAALGVSNQRETTLLWDAESGKPLANAIVWQCRRTAGRCQQLREAGLEPAIQAKTGLRLDPYFSATKLEWLMHHCAEAERLNAQQRLRAGTVDTFLVWRLTDGSVHVTDHTNASRTMLLDLSRLDWAEDLLELFSTPRSILPKLVPSCGVVGETDTKLFGAPIPIAGIVGDQQAALFGHGANKPGDCKNTYGTGCFLLMNVGQTPAPPAQGVLSTVAWTMTDSRSQLQVSYALEGSVFMAGGAARWACETLGVAAVPERIGQVAAQAPDNGGVFFVPALTGLGAPYWDAGARGLLIGLSAATKQEHIARAVEEAICLQSQAVISAMGTASGRNIDLLRVDGGAAHDDFLLQLQADISGIPVRRPKIRETTALGAAAMAGIAVGFWSEEQAAALAGIDRTFMPKTEAGEREKLIARWNEAVERARAWTTGHPAANFSRGQHNERSDSVAFSGSAEGPIS